MRTVLRRLMLAAIAAAVIGSVVYAFLPKPVAVDLARVTVEPMQVTVVEDGKTRIRERHIVSSPLAGRLQRITLEPGDSVEAGSTVLARIEPTDPALLDPRAVAEAEARVKAAEARVQQANTELERARAALEFAESDLARVRQLQRQQAVSQQEVDERELLLRLRSQEFRAARFAEEIARYESELARAALLRTQPRSESQSENWLFEIVAPISGRVLNVLQESATVVTPGSQLLELGDPQDLEIEIDVLSRDAVKIRPGDLVYLEDWGGDEPLKGSVRLIEPSGFTKISALGVEEQRVNVIADFSNPGDAQSTLGDGYRVEAHIVIWQGERVRKVPTGSLFRHEGDWAVFVVRERRAVVRPIKIGHRNSTAVEVLDGLQEGEMVILYPSDQVADGVSVVVR